MKRLLQLIPLLTFALAALCQACDDDETYADKRKREDQQIKTFLQTGIYLSDTDTGAELLNVPGNIKVISEDEFNRNDSTTDVSKNEYVLFKNTGIYMQILDKGTGSRLEDGEYSKVITRYIEVNLSTDSVQTTNKITTYEMQPDEMNVSNSLGVFTASFTSGVMKSFYNTSAVPNGWLVPLTYINLGRLNSDDATLAHVRLILPSSQGQSDASTNIYPCFYDITYQRGR